MRKSRLSLTLAAIFTLSFGLAACSDPDDQRGDPTEPTQEAPATERDARQQDVRDERNVSEELNQEGLDAASDPTNQPTPATAEYRQDLLAQNVSNLGDTDDPSTVRTFQQEHAELQQTIRQALSRNRADDIDQCAMVPFGHSPCGGAETYLVYSQRDMSSDEIEDFEEKVARYNQLDAFLKTSRNIVGTCEVTPVPEIVFENGRCMASGRGSSSFEQVN